ncbi:MAG: twin-arginine translocase TatA/TatE family subunit [Gammaproteobacteria bacterium]|nr:twin-arginine translocase TatA/TatE family subunit [Gammaproteobacteria bacterium]
MGFGNIGIWQLLIILLIVVVIFGTKKLRSMGGDVGGAVKNFREAMNDEDKDKGADKRPGALGDHSSPDGGQQSTARSDKHGTD